MTSIRETAHPAGGAPTTQPVRRYPQVLHTFGERARVAHAGIVRREHRLRTRRDFERTRSGGRVARPEFVLYHFAREAPEVPRVGFAVGRRIGGATVRNRTRRRLREAIRPLIPRLVACDIAVVARPPAREAGVAELQAALADAVARAGLLRT